MYGRSLRDPSKAIAEAERSVMGGLDATGAASETNYASYTCLPEKSNSAQHGVKQQQIDKKNSQDKAKKYLNSLHFEPQCRLEKDFMRVSVP